MREELEARGIQLSADYTFESATNARGGLYGPYLRGAGQFAVRGVFDYERMLGIRGGTGAFTITQRHGRDVTADAALGTQTSVTEIFGRGRIARLTALWYEQQLGRWGSVKFGRMPMSEDFAAFSSEFQLLALVGSQPGKIVGDYWYNWPVSQWGARLRAGSMGTAYIQTGAFQVNPDNLENGFSFDFSRGRGTLLPV